MEEKRKRAPPPSKDELVTTVKEVKEPHYFGAHLVRKFHGCLLKRYKEKQEDEAKSAWSSNSELIGSLRPQVKTTGDNTGIQSATIPCVAGVMMMPSVEPLPRMTYYAETPRNIRTPDSSYLTHLPAIPPASTEEEVEFYAMLQDKYKGKISPKDGDDGWMQKLHPDILRDLVLGLGIMKRVFMSSDILAADGQSTTETHAPTYAELQRMANFLTASEHENYAQRFEMIPDEVFFLLANNVRGAGTQETLKTWYRKTFLVKPDPLPSSKDYNNAFCRKCYTYGCAFHQSKTVDGSGPSSTALATHYINQVKEARKNEKSKNKLKCSDEKCVKEGNNPPLVTVWSAEERSLCDDLYQSFENACHVAMFMKTKTCTQVMDYIKGNNTTDATASPPDAPGKTENIWKKYKSTTIIPCSHYGSCDDNCSCYIRGVRCEKMCCCTKTCKRRFAGCKCSTTCATNRCPCFLGFRECDPDICKSCGSHKVDYAEVTCRNVGMQRRKGHRIRIGKSTVSGWGGFACEDIPCGDYIDEYTGEVVSNLEANKRGVVYDQNQHTYLFNLHDGFTVDATRIGNNTRFLNSSKAPNCMPRVKIVNGERRIGLFAARDIKVDEELFFDYEDVLQKTNTKTTSTDSSPS